MTKAMTPVRWLVAIALAAAVYIAIVTTAFRMGSPIPQQLHSIALTAMTGGALIAAVAAIIKNHDEAMDRRDVRLYAQIVAISQRLAARDEAVPLPEVTAEIHYRAPASVYRATACVIDEADTLREIESEMKGWIARDLDGPDDEIRT